MPTTHDSATCTNHYTGGDYCCAIGEALATGRGLCPLCGAPLAANGYACTDKDCDAYACPAECAEDCTDALCGVHDSRSIGEPDED